MPFLFGAGMGGGMGEGNPFTPPPTPIPRPQSPFDIVTGGTDAGVAGQMSPPPPAALAAPVPAPVPAFTPPPGAAPPPPASGGQQWGWGGPGANDGDPMNQGGMPRATTAAYTGGGDSGGGFGGGFEFREGSILGTMQRAGWRREAYHSFSKFMAENPNLPANQQIQAYMQTPAGGRAFDHGMGSDIIALWKQAQAVPISENDKILGGQILRPDPQTGVYSVVASETPPEVRKAIAQADLLSHSPDPVLRAIVEAQTYSEPLAKHKLYQDMIDAHQITVEQARMLETGMIESYRDPVKGTVIVVSKIPGAENPGNVGGGEPISPIPSHRWSNQQAGGSAYGFQPPPGAAQLPLPAVVPPSGAAPGNPAAPILPPGATPPPANAPLPAPPAAEPSAQRASMDEKGHITIPGATDPLDKYKGGGWFNALIASGAQKLSVLFPDLGAPITTARREQLNDLALKVTQLETVGQGRLKVLQAPMLEMISLIKNNGELGAVAGAISLHNSVADLITEDEAIFAAGPDSANPQSTENRNNAAAELVALHQLDKALTGGNPQALMDRYNGLKDGTIKQADVGDLIKSLPATIDKMGDVLDRAIHGKPSTGKTTEDIRLDEQKAPAEPSEAEVKTFMKTYEKTAPPSFLEEIRKSQPNATQKDADGAWPYVEDKKAFMP